MRYFIIGYLLADFIKFVATERQLIQPKCEDQVAAIVCVAEDSAIKVVWEVLSKDVFTLLTKPLPDSRPDGI